MRTALIDRSDYSQMEREILKEKINEDGSYTRIERTIQTPEDNVVPNKAHRAEWDYPGRDTGMFERGRFKGHKLTITYFKTHTKKTRVIFYVAYILVAVIFVGIFMGVILAQNISETANKYKLYLVGIVAFLVYGFVKSVLSFKKQDKQCSDISNGTDEPPVQSNDSKVI